MTNNFIGKKVLIKTNSGEFSGRLTAFNEEEGKIIIEDSYNISNELDLLNVLEVQMLESQPTNLQKEKIYSPLSERRMYELFDDAFNIYGPFEDNFYSIIALALKKFIKDGASARIKVIVGSDDVFGRIGLCFARFMIGRVSSLEVEIRCALKNFKTLSYFNAYKNSGGHTTNMKSQSKASYTMILFACNRHFNFSIENAVSNHIIILDIPKHVNFPFTGLGLGFKPENYKNCSRFYYLLDAGFPLLLCEKYEIPSFFKNSLVKEFID